MKKTISALLLILATAAVFAQNNISEEFRLKFNHVKTILQYEKFTKALPVLKELETLDPDNPNVKYLIGVCYVATGTEKEKAVELLEYAVKYYTNAYNPNSFKERNTPIYSLYYLCVAYCDNARCEDAKKIFAQFEKIIQDNSNSYIRDGSARLRDCLEKEKPALAEAKEEDLLKKDKKKEAKKDSLKTREKINIPTRRVVYTTKDHLYGVQIGAFTESLPANNFPGLKNVQSFMDKDGVVRYVIGSHVFRSQAEILKNAVIEAGYKDAYIVDVNEVRKFSEEVIHPYKEKKRGKIEYRVQLGAYRTEMSLEQVKKYLEIDGIDELADGDLTLLTAGSFPDYESTEMLKNDLIGKGIKDAFIIALHKGKKISVKEAGEFQNTNKEEPKKKTRKERRKKNKSVFK